MSLPKALLACVRACLHVLDPHFGTGDLRHDLLSPFCASISQPIEDLSIRSWSCIVGSEVPQLSLLQRHYIDTTYLCLRLDVCVYGHMFCVYVCLHFYVASVWNLWKALTIILLYIWPYIHVLCKYLTCQRSIQKTALLPVACGIIIRAVGSWLCIWRSFPSERLWRGAINLFCCSYDGDRYTSSAAHGDMQVPRFHTSAWAYHAFTCVEPFS